MSNTIQKRREREAFIHRHRATLHELTAGDKYYNPPRTSPAVAAFVNDVARPTLGYAHNTDADSIWFTLHRAYRKLYPHPSPQ